MDRQIPFREYIRIRHELREKCRENYNKNWEDKITDLMDHNKNSSCKSFGINLKY